MTKEEAKKLLEAEGEARGVVLKTDFDYILRKTGKEALAKLETEVERLVYPLLGYTLKREEIKTLGFYPIGLRVISLLAIKDIFGFSEEEIQEMGVAAPKFSLIIKLFSKYFLSVKDVAVQAPLMWKKHYSLGDLVVTRVDEEKRNIVLQIEGLNLHPIFCRYLLGYFTTVIQMVSKGKVSPEETKCFFHGEKYHEYSFKW